MTGTPGRHIEEPYESVSKSIFFVIPETAGICIHLKYVR